MPHSWFYPCKGCRGNAMSWVLWSPTSQWPSKFSVVISTLSSTSCVFTSWPVQSPLFSVFILQLFQFSALTSEHETRFSACYYYFEDLAQCCEPSRQNAPTLWGFCVEVIKLRQWNCFIYFIKFVIGFINFLWTFITIGRNWVKFWISVSYETTVLSFISAGYAVLHLLLQTLSSKLTEKVYF